MDPESVSDLAAAGVLGTDVIAVLVAKAKDRSVDLVRILDQGPAPC